MLPGHPSGPGDPPKPWREVLMSESPVSKGGTVLRPFYILSITPPMVLIIIISVSDGDLHPDYSLLYLESSRFLKLTGHPSGPDDPPKPWPEVLMSESPVWIVLRALYILPSHSPDGFDNYLCFRRAG